MIRKNTTAQKNTVATETAMVKKTLVSACGMVVSRVMGLIRDICIAHVLGIAADPFLVAFRIPNFMRRLVSEGTLGMTHINELAKKEFSAGSSSRSALVEAPRALGGKHSSFVFSTKVALLQMGAGLLLALLFFLFATPVIATLAPGLATPLQTEAVSLLRVCLAYVPFASGSAVLAATLVSYGRVGVAALSPALLNLGILAFGMCALLQGSSLTTSSAAMLFSLGVAVGGGLQFLWLFAFFSLTGKKMAYHAERGLLTEPSLHATDLRQGAMQPDVVAPVCSSSPLSEGVQSASLSQKKSSVFPQKTTAGLKKIPLMVMGASSQQFHMLVAAVAATYLVQGSLSALYFAERMAEFPLALAGVSIATVSMPEFAKNAATGNKAQYAKALENALWLCLFFAIPAAVGLGVLALPITYCLFGHGAFLPDEQVKTSQALAVLACGLPAMCMVRPLTSAVVAFDSACKAVTGEKNKNVFSSDSRALAVCAGITGISSLVVLVASMTAIGTLGIKGVTAAVSLGAWVQAGLLMLVLQRKGVFISNPFFSRQMAGYLLCGGLLGVGLYGLLPRFSSGRGALMLELGAVILLAVFLWLFLFYHAGSREAKTLLAAIKKKR